MNDDYVFIGVRQLAYNTHDDLWRGLKYTTMIYHGARHHKGSSNSRSRKKSAHNQGRKPKGHFDASAEAKTCIQCEAYKPLTSFRRSLSRGLGTDAYDPICKSCRQDDISNRAVIEPAADMPMLPSLTSIAALNDAECTELFQRLRWPDGVLCPKCTNDKLYDHNRGDVRGWLCAQCSHTFTVTSGTPFASRKVSLQVVLAMISLAQHGRGVVIINRVAGELGISYKSAYALIGKAAEFLTRGPEGRSVFTGYWQGASEPAPRAIAGEPASLQTCHECNEEKPAEAFALKSGAAGAWGLRVSVCKACINARSAAGIRRAWQAKKAADLIPLYPPHGHDLAEKAGNREIPPNFGLGAAPGRQVVLHTATELLTRAPRFSSGGTAMWWSTRSRWANQERQDLAVLCEAAAPIERAADVLGRSPSSIAWMARDMGLTLAPEWRALVAPKRGPSTPRLQLHYPFIQRARPSHADLLRVNDLVPRAFPEHMRADICQNIMLALYEGDITLAKIQANRTQLSWFVKRWRKQQAPSQEVQLTGYSDSDDRPYEDIAAALKSEAAAAARDDLRHAWSAWQPFADPTQVDDVYRREIHATRLHAFAAGVPLDQTDAEEWLETSGKSGIEFLRQSFRADEARVPLHARTRAAERYGVNLDRAASAALIAYCAHRRPDHLSHDDEIHIVRDMPVVFNRAGQVVKTILPPEWLTEHREREFIAAI